VVVVVVRGGGGVENTMEYNKKARQCKEKLRYILL
jgi:hypothetical protein